MSLNTAGQQTISVTDNATNFIGTSAAITTRGLTVTALTQKPTGFTVIFSKAFVAADLALYGANLTRVADVTMRGAHVGPIHGSLMVDPTNTSVTFSASSSYLQLLNSLAHPATVSSLLPDDTYTITLVAGAGSNGFLDGAASGLDGSSSAGHANFVTTFATHYQANATPALAIPDFARGPTNNAPIAVPNGGGGIPVTLYNARNVTDVTFTVTYNPALLTVTGAAQGATSDATDPAGTFALVSAAGGVATFHYHNTNALSATATTPLVLGDILAVVPNSAANNYKAVEMLALGNIVINNGGIAGATGAVATHINAYFGDVNGDGTIDGRDILTANQVATGIARGFGAYPLVDPATTGDVAGDISVDAGDVSIIDAFVSRLNPAQIPPIPTLNVSSPGALVANITAGE